MSIEALMKLDEKIRNKLTQGEILTRDCESGVKDFLMDQQGNPFVVLPFEDHEEVCQTKSMHFRNWMAERFRKKYGSPPNRNAVEQAQIQVEARCEKSTKVELYNRVGMYEGAIYYDLTTPDWRGIKITKEGWSVVYLPPIFKRYKHQAEQVIPIQNGDPLNILNFLNISKSDRFLFVAIIASFFIPDIPHVIPGQNGEQGSGKSCNSRLIKKLVDPSLVTLMSTPKDLEHAQMIAEKHWVNAFDNVSKILEWFSDFLCRAVTGEGDMKRSLYTDDNEFIRAYRRCFITNGIGLPLERPDLLDRSIIFEIPLLANKKAEKMLEEEWKIALPGILGGFFDIIAKSMKVIDQVKGHENFRMADFARWGAAFFEVIGLSQQNFFDKYKESIDRKWQDAADKNTLVGKVMQLVERYSWSGTLPELLDKLNPGHDKFLPLTPQGLASALKRIAPVLRQNNIEFVDEEKREGGSGRYLYSLRKSGHDSTVKSDVKRCEGCEESESNQTLL